MKIIYLDKPSYLPETAVRKLETLGEVVVYDDMPSSEEAVRRLSGADIAIVEWTDISADMIEKIERLKCIVLVTTGYEFVDGEAARKKGITLCNTPDYSRQSVAEHVFGMFLAMAKRIPAADQLVRQGKVEYTDHVIGTELFDKTLGILGLGSIGSWVANIGKGFGMKVIGFTRTPRNIPEVTERSLDDVLGQSDFLAVCLSVNPSTEGLLNESKLNLIKPTAYIANIASNKILDESFIAEMLRNGKLAGAAFEHVINEELLHAPNTLLSPGSAWYTQDSLDRNVEMFVETVFAFSRNEPRFVVN